MTDLAALLGAFGAVAVLLAGRRVVLLGGLVIVAAAEVLLARSGGLHLSIKLVAAGAFGVLVLAALALPLRRARWLVAPLLLLLAPLPPPLDFRPRHRL